MQSVYQDVMNFHKATSQPVRNVPSFPSPEEIELRNNLLKEEVQEYFDAVSTHDIVEVADALGDIVYIVAGTALCFGIDLPAVWNEIQKTNMAKADPTTGKVRRREDGKILKPEGWKPPDIKGVLGI